MSKPSAPRPKPKTPAPQQPAKIEPLTGYQSQSAKQLDNLRARLIEHCTGLSAIRDAIAPGDAPRTAPTHPAPRSTVHDCLADVSAILSTAEAIAADIARMT